MAKFYREIIKSPGKKYRGIFLTQSEEKED